MLTPTLQWYYLSVLDLCGLASGCLYGTQWWTIHHWSSCSSSMIHMGSSQMPNPWGVLSVSYRIVELLWQYHILLCHSSHRWQGSFLCAWDVSFISFDPIWRVVMLWCHQLWARSILPCRFIGSSRAGHKWQHLFPPLNPWWGYRIWPQQ